MNPIIFEKIILKLGVNNISDIDVLKQKFREVGERSEKWFLEKTYPKNIEELKEYLMKRYPFYATSRALRICSIEHFDVLDNIDFGDVDGFFFNPLRKTVVLVDSELKKAILIVPTSWKAFLKFREAFITEDKVKNYFHNQYVDIDTVPMKVITDPEEILYETITLNR